MLSYVVVFWVGLVGHPEMGAQKVVIPYTPLEGAPSHVCPLAAEIEAQTWVDDHAAWVLLTDQPHHARCVEKRSV